MTTVLSALIILGLLVFVHELGHFWVAKRGKVGVLAFSLGFGPRLFGLRRGGTDYRFSAIPLGGFVRMVGEHPGDEVEPQDIPRSFSHKPLAWRFAIVAAGPISNILLAFVLYVVLISVWGLPTLTTRVGGVLPDQPAAQAGIQKNDLVLAINGQAINRWSEMVERIQASGGQPVRLVVDREGRKLNLTMKPRLVEAKNIFGEPQKVFRVGIAASQETVTEEVGLGRSLVLAAKSTYGAVEVVVLTVVKLVQRKMPLDSVGGPILIAQVAGEAADHGLDSLLHVAALISVNLGVLNLLPIPILDGGHLFFFLLEAIRRKPVPLVVREKAQQVGMAALLFLMGIIFYNDIVRLLTGATQ